MGNPEREGAALLQELVKTLLLPLEEGWVESLQFFFIFHRFSMKEQFPKSLGHIVCGLTVSNAKPHHSQPQHFKRHRLRALILGI